jgi:hypothetical protein
MGAESEEGGSVVRNRIYELPDDIETDVLTAVEEFTVPCKLCVPGAREMGELVPFYFVVEAREEDWLTEEEEYLPDDAEETN